MFKDSKAEKPFTNLLIPSLQEPLEPLSSPILESKHQIYMERGRLTHKLLDLLAKTADFKRRELGRHYLISSSTILDQSVQNEILNETLDVLRNPDFKKYFGPNSIAEVPVAGIIEGEIDSSFISGQIDRLVVTKKKITIIDFKTDRVPPSNPNNIPKSYMKQLSAYRLALREIYPDKSIEAVILWTCTSKVSHLTLKS